VSALLIWGGGGHGKVVADLVRAAGYRVAGFVDADAAKLGRQVEPGGGCVVMLQGDLLARVRDHGRLPEGIDGVALAIGDNRLRLDCLARLGDGVPAPALVHPSAVVSPSASVDRGSVVFAGALVNADARIGAAVIVNTGAIVEHDCDIGDGAHLSPRATLAGQVRVGRRGWVGAGATVIQRVVLGADTIIGAGAAVIRDVEDGSTVAGVPARTIRSDGGR
jgi:sugar O-acyltransferase (sialic acid O-acetyltransferase NeuD family)